MEWDQKQNASTSEDHNHQQLNNGGGGMFVKVMTDEQMEVLRKQIAVYATICEQLVDLHKSLTAHSDIATGVRLGNIYCDPMITSGAHKISGRQRWTPTPMQLQILERMFDQGIGTPSKQKIKEITSELSQHGQISETNVYNWFQNRRARSKRKQQTAQSNNNNNNNAESEVETEVESPGHEKKTKPDESFHLQQHQQQMLSSRKRDNASFQNNQIANDSMFSADIVRSSRPDMVLSAEGSSKFGGDFGQMALYGSMLSSPRTDHLIAKVEVDGSYSPYMQPDHDFNLA